MGLTRAVMTALLLSLLGITVITDASMGFPHCWGSAAIVLSDGGEKTPLRGRLDSLGNLHLFWYNKNDDWIYHICREADGDWTETEKLAHTAFETFDIALDSSNQIHLVWCDATGLGEPGQTSNLYYKRTENGVWADSECVTCQYYNDPSDIDTLDAESFEDGMSEAWSWETSNTGKCEDPETYWGGWEVMLDGDLAHDGEHLALGNRFEGCGPLCDLLACRAYLVMPPFLISEGDSFSFWIRLSEAGSAGVRLVIVERFAGWTFQAFTDTAAASTLWVDSTVTDTSYQEVKVALPAALAGKIVFLAFELFSTSSTSVGVCIDDVCSGVGEAARPKIPLNPAVCEKPCIAVESGGDVHVAFERALWEPEACVCSGQIFYTRRDASSGSWGEPAHIDSSGVGDRNYAHPYIWRGATDPVIGIDADGNVHVAWKDIGLGNFESGGDDIFYSRRAAGSGDSEWQDSPFRVSDDGEDGSEDSSYYFCPAMAIDGSGVVSLVFHGVRAGSAAVHGEDPGETRGNPRSHMGIWWRQRATDGSWSPKCMRVPDPDPNPDSDEEVLDCRHPSIAPGSDGDLFATWVWRDRTGDNKAASALATYIGADSEWVSPARVIRLPSLTRRVAPTLCIQIDSSGDAHLAWTERDSITSETYAIAYMKSIAEWDSCVGTPSVYVEEFQRWLCPRGNADSGDVFFEATVTIVDTAGVPMPRVPPDNIFMTVAGDTVAPGDTCVAFEDSTLSFGGNEIAYVFWCGSNDMLTATDSTNADGQTLLSHGCVSGRARLRVVPYIGWALGGQEDTCWINTCDQIPIPYSADGAVLSNDFGAFTTAHSRWMLDSKENWTWDLSHRPEDECTINGASRPIFAVTGGDFSAFATHYNKVHCPDSCQAE